MRHLGKCVLAVCLALSTSCDGEADIAQNEIPIINGDVVQDGQFPTVGMMMVVATAARNGGMPKRGPLSLCTATLISPTAVLLAAHCVDEQIRNASLQQAGITVTGPVEFRFTYNHSINDFIQDNGTSREFLDKPSLLKVASTEQMPINIFGSLQRPGQMDDIALLHLAQPVKGRPVQKLATAQMANGMQVGSKHAVAGYGQTSNDPGDFNGDGMPDDPGLSAGTLHSGVSKLNNIGDHEVIAGNMDPQQACRGDSGGPLFADETSEFQMGIASRINAFPTPGASGPPRCEPGLLYTRVDAYLTWIQQHVPDLGQPTQPCTPNDTDPSCPNASSGGEPDAGTTPPPGSDGAVPGAPDAGSGHQGGDDMGGDQDGGCGCTVARGETPATGGAIVLLLVGLVAVRRRRRGQ
jgi:MYXO-CTERM domain-containing protein